MLIQLNVPIKNLLKRQIFINILHHYQLFISMKLSNKYQKLSLNGNKFNLMSNPNNVQTLQSFNLPFLFLSFH